MKIIVQVFLHCQIVEKLWGKNVNLYLTPLMNANVIQMTIIGVLKKKGLALDLNKSKAYKKINVFLKDVFETVISIT
jgi:hypothetical protein